MKNIIISIDGRQIDPSLIQNPKLRRIMSRRPQDFMFNYGDKGSHSDHTDVPHTEYSDYGDKYHSDHTDYDNHSEHSEYSDYSEGNS